MAFLRTTTQSHPAFINYDVIKAVNVAYAKTRQTEPYKVHRVLKNKIDDLTTVSSSIATNLNLSLRSSSEPLPSAIKGEAFGTSLMMEGEAADLEALVKGVISAVRASHHGKGSDVPATLRDLWGGRPGYHRMRKDEKEKEKETERILSKSSSRDVFLDGGEEDGGSKWKTTSGKVRGKSQAIVDGFAGWTG